MFHSESDFSIIEYVLLSLLSFFLSSIDWHKFKLLWAISFRFYCWYMIGNLQRRRSGGIIQNSLTCSLLIFRTTDWYDFFPNLSKMFIIKLSKLHNIIWDHGSSDENIVEQVGATMLSRPCWWFLAGDVCLSPEPIGSTHLPNCFFWMSSLAFFWFCSSNGMYGCKTLLFGIYVRWALISNSSDFYFFNWFRYYQ